MSESDEVKATTAEPAVEAGVEAAGEPAAPVRAEADARPGLPIWMPLVGLLIAFGFAVFVGAGICPTLSALVLPPDPPLPTGKVTQTLHESKGTGSDEWVFSTPLAGCEVARFYESRLGGCIWDPDSRCQFPNGRPPTNPGSASHVAQCSGRQSVGAYQVLWTVYIATNYPEDQGDLTHFRVIREVGN